MCNVQNIFYFFDIETSRIVCDNGEEIQVTYLTNVLTFDLLNGKIVDSRFFRTLHDTVNYFKEISSSSEITVYSHNLDYELTFLLRETNANAYIEDFEINEYGEYKEECILRNKHSPLSIRLDCIPNVTFKDSWALLGKSVSKLGDDLKKRTNFDLTKLDYDYSKIRLPWDELEQLDYDYNERDNVIVAYSIYYLCQDENIPIDNIPLTFTAKNKRNRQNFIIKEYGQSSIVTLNYNQRYSIKSYDFYNTSVNAYTGGLTTANFNYINKQIRNVYSVDIKSSYPYQMCTRRYPTFSEGDTIHLRGKNANDYYIKFLHGFRHYHLQSIKVDTNGVKGYMAYVRIENIEIKNDDYLLPLSISKCIDHQDVVQINGKIKKAKVIELYLTNVMLDVINMCYTYENIQVSELFFTRKDSFLPQQEISYILHLFNIKENIDKEKYPIEYALSKAGINGGYGIKVQKPIKDFYSIVDGDIKVITFNKLTYEERQSVYNEYINMQEQRWEESKGAKFNKSFDIFSDGVYITDYARYQLVAMMIKLTKEGYVCVYCDTDSLKFTPKFNKLDVNGHNQKIDTLINDINQQITTRNMSLYRFSHFKEKFNVGDNEYYKICRLGIWEVESGYETDNGFVIAPYPYFKTLGAKKYAYISMKNKQDVKINTTIAGCSKGVTKYIEQLAINENIEKWEALDLVFKIGTKFDVGVSGRTIAERDERDRIACEELTVDGELINQYGGIIIRDTTYTLNLSANDCVQLNIMRVTEPQRLLNDKGELIEYE